MGPVMIERIVLNRGFKEAPAQEHMCYVRQEWYASFDALVDYPSSRTGVCIHALYTGKVFHLYVRGHGAAGVPVS